MTLPFFQKVSSQLNLSKVSLGFRPFNSGVAAGRTIGKETLALFVDDLLALTDSVGLGFLARGEEIRPNEDALQIAVVARFHDDPGEAPLTVGLFRRRPDLEAFIVDRFAAFRCFLALSRFPVRPPRMRDRNDAMALIYLCAWHS